MNFGDFIKINGSWQTSINAVFKAQDFLSDGRRCDLLSNYIGEYLKYFFDKKDRSENLISTVIYELLTYLVNCANLDGDVQVSINHNQENIIFDLSSSINEESKDSIVALFNILSDGNVGDYFISLLTNPYDELVIRADYGLFMILHDYKAQIALSYDEKTDDLCMQIAIKCEEI